MIISNRLPTLPLQRTAGRKREKSYQVVRTLKGKTGGLCVGNCLPVLVTFWFLFGLGTVCLLPNVDYSMEQSLGYLNYFLTGFGLNCPRPKMCLLVFLSSSISLREKLGRDQQKT